MEFKKIKIKSFDNLTNSTCTNLFFFFALYNADLTLLAFICLSM